MVICLSFQVTAVLADADADAEGVVVATLPIPQLTVMVNTNAKLMIIPRVFFTVVSSCSFLVDLNSESMLLVYELMLHYFFLHVHKINLLDTKNVYMIDQSCFM